MSETESNLATPVNWFRGAAGTISVGRARVKGEALVELVIHDAVGSSFPYLLAPDGAARLAERLLAAADAAPAIPEAAE